MFRIKYKDEGDDVNILIENIRKRYERTVRWLKENYPNICEEQKHLDARSIERGYWHYGYAVALRDILDKNPLFPEDLPKTEDYK